MRFYLKRSSYDLFFLVTTFMFSDKTILDKALEDVGFMQVHREVSHCAMLLIVDLAFHSSRVKLNFFFLCGSWQSN